MTMIIMILMIIIIMNKYIKPVVKVGQIGIPYHGVVVTAIVTLQADGSYGYVGHMPCLFLSIASLIY